MRLATLCFLIKDNQVCLAMKKRGFGVGKWNGVGGKVAEGETIVGATSREAGEEIGVRVLPEELEYKASLRFYFNEKPEW
ncbi:MAG: NUDIX domain-containing protein, partial [Parcubacteria group bacterium]|nr:NUDIX domain-containing protein [Parcubacteria group bacterium]